MRRTELCRRHHAPSPPCTCVGEPALRSERGLPVAVFPPFERFCLGALKGRAQSYTEVPYERRRKGRSVSVSLFPSLTFSGCVFLGVCVYAFVDVCHLSSNSNGKLFSSGSFLLFLPSPFPFCSEQRKRGRETQSCSLNRNSDPPALATLAKKKKKRHQKKGSKCTKGVLVSACECVRASVEVNVKAVSAERERVRLR